MAHYVMLLKFTDQGIRNVKDTTKRAAAAADMAGKMGVKVTSTYWTMGDTTSSCSPTHPTTKPSPLCQSNSARSATSRLKRCGHSPPPRWTTLSRKSAKRKSIEWED